MADHISTPAVAPVAVGPSVDDLETAITNARDASHLLSYLLCDLFDVRPNGPFYSVGSDTANAVSFANSTAVDAARKANDLFQLFLTAELQKRAAARQGTDALERLALLYREGLDRYERDCVVGMDNDSCDRLAWNTFRPYFDRLTSDPPAPTTLNGALAGLRTLLDEANGDVEASRMACAMLPPIIAFLEARA